MYARPLPLRLLHPPPWPYASRPNQMTLKGCSACPPARSACSALPPLHPPSMALDPHGPHGPMPPWLLAPWPPMSPCFDGQPPILSRPNQMTLKGLSACPPAPPAPLAPPFPRSTRPPWPSTPMAPMDPCLHGPMAPGGMSPCFDGQPPTLWLLAPWPHLKGPSACPPPHGPQCLHASTANPLLCNSWPHGPMVP